jgi:hypothetical protein
MEHQTTAMRHLIIAIAMTGFGIIPALARAEERDSTGMPGDNFDLQGAMELFRTSNNLEAFEKALNTEKNAVNNLDLNGDKKTDYISVYDKADGDNHAIILRVAVNEKETQDIAAIAIQKTGDKKAQMQIIGSKDLYGEEKIMEPYSESEAKQQGPADYSAALQPAIVFVNVWSWPCVSYMYGPGYSYYSSPWYWNYYPMWWDPWAPYYWYSYYPRVQHYHYMYYQTAYACYVPAAQNVYYNHRSSSPYVSHRYEQARQEYNSPRAREARQNQQVSGSQGRISSGRQPVKAQPAQERRAVSPDARPTTQPQRVERAPQPQSRPANIERQAPVERQTPVSRPQPAQRSYPEARPAPAQRQAPVMRPAPAPRQAPMPRSAPSSRPAGRPGR